MTLLGRINTKSVQLLFSAAALVGISDRPSITVQGAPAPAIFTLPAGNATVDLDAYRAAFNRWNREGGHTRARNAGSHTTEVSIEAYPWAHAQGPKHVPAAGKAVLVGRLVNIGSATTDMYGLRPGVEYFLFATNVGGATGWEMREVGPGSSGMMPIRAMGMYTSCNHPPASRSEADFRQCTTETSMASELKVASSAGMSAVILEWIAVRSAKAFRDDPAWISCDGGCCTLNVM